MSSSLATDAVGWIATGILVLTVGRQAFSQWKEGRTKGLSKWLFVGQLAASTGFVIYSWLLDNIVFVVSNVFLLIIAAIGQVLYVRNRKREGKSAADDT
jgi:MtN3 and saliva related transmembrane protein